ncbi:MAG: hypothetical protein HYW34_03890 [Candidatus Brennerbacteria bacterium]|nr:hypothetical protein [Candidatus Brennerbacteria bacterium]
MASEGFGDFIKAAVDIEKEIMAIGGELHADEEVMLIEKENSKREHVWGINIYPKKSGAEMIEYDSMINLKPAFGNRSRNIEDVEVKETIKKIVQKLIID